MPHDWPDLPELVRTVREFLRTLDDDLEGQQHYRARCAEYLLGIVERELQEWQPQPGGDDEALEAVLSKAAVGGSGSPIERLSRALREGHFDQDLDSLLPELLRHVEHKISVSKPQYLRNQQT